MRAFTVKYTVRGKAATVTVQGNEIATMDDVLCIRDDGVQIATFPKEDVLHVTSRSDNNNWTATAGDDPESTPWSPVEPHPARTLATPRTAVKTPVSMPLRRPLQPITGVRISRRIARPLVSR